MAAFDELLDRAWKAAAALREQSNAVPDAEQVRRELRDFFSRIPEPPVYERRDDSIRSRAASLLAEGETLLSRALAAGEDSIATWMEALHLYLRALIELRDGRLTAAETHFRRAAQLEAMASGLGSLPAPRPVFDRREKVSRYDAHDRRALSVLIPCPKCHMTSPHALAAQDERQRWTCPRCQSVAFLYVAVVRTIEVHNETRSRRRYVFRVDPLHGVPSRVEFVDTNHAELSAAPKDLLAFIYAPATELRGVLNVATRRVLWIHGPGPCFLATAVYGEHAPELDAFRDLRDRHLRRSRPGRLFIRVYYLAGPALAAVVRNLPPLQRAARVILTRLHAVLVREPE